MIVPHNEFRCRCGGVMSCSNDVPAEPPEEAGRAGPPPCGHTGCECAAESARLREQLEVFRGEIARLTNLYANLQAELRCQDCKEYRATVAARERALAEQLERAQQEERDDADAASRLYELAVKLHDPWAEKGSH